MVASMATLQKPLRVAVKSRPFASTAGILPVVFASLQKRSKITRSHLWNALGANGFTSSPLIEAAYAAFPKV
jgi:hypothetical protein